MVKEAEEGEGMREGEISMGQVEEIEVSVYFLEWPWGLLS